MTAGPSWHQQFASIGTLEGLSRLRDFVRRRIFLIAFMTILGLVSGIAANLLLPTLYTARLTIEIQPDRSGEFRVHPAPSPGAEVDNARIETEIQILQSRELALHVIRALHLESGSELAKCPHALPWDLYKEQDREHLIDTFEARTTVSRLGRSRLIEIRMKARTPTSAAQMANTLAAEYLQRGLTRPDAEQPGSANWTSEQLAALKHRIETSQRQMQSLASQTNAAGISELGKSSLSTQVEELERNLANAEADRLLKEARISAMQSAPSEIAAAMAGPNALLHSYQTSLQQLHSEYDSLGQTYGNAYPRMVELKSQIQALQSTIAAEQKAQIDRTKKELDIAVSTSGELRASLQRLQSELIANESAAVQYQLARREYEANQLLYQELQRREQESSIVAGFRAGSVRIVDRADIPAFPSDPKKIINVLVGFLAGLILGVGMGFALELFVLASSATYESASVRKPPQPSLPHAVWERLRQHIS